MFAKSYIEDLLKSCREKLIIYRKKTDGEYNGGIEHTVLINWIDEALSEIDKTSNSAEQK
jgi:hypothetical protein